MRVPDGMPRFVLICLPLFALSVLAVGCGSEGTVSGKVYLRGQPVTGGTVHFVPEGKGGNYASVIGTDGSYSVSKLPLGPAKIGVTGMTGGTKGVPAAVFNRQGGRQIAKAFKQMASTEKSEGSKGGRPPDASLAVPEKYADPDQSGLKLDVTSGSQSFDIKME
jgi:hypothetical protein